MLLTLELIAGAFIALVLLYYYCISNFDFWKKRGVKGPEPMILFGNFKEVLFRRLSLTELIQSVYDEYKGEPVVGIFVRSKPTGIVLDPELIKDVLIRDFKSFAERGMPLFEKTEPLSQHLFSLEARRWRPLRTRLSPVFTSGKLKEMFHLIVECADHLEEYLEKVAAKNEPVEFRELTAKFTTDVIGSCAFGIEMNSIADEDSEFRKMGRSSFQLDWPKYIRFRVRESMPTFYKMLGYVLPPTKEAKFFIASVAETIEFRKTNNVNRPDFIDTLIQLKNHPEKLGDNINVNDTFLAAQAFVFFLAGFETSSTTMSHALYELALNPEVQNKLRMEIKEKLKECKDKLTYEDVKAMNYLDLVFRETLRKYPPATFLIRQSCENYTFSGTKITIPKKTGLFIPVYSIHRDPNYYPDPEAFIPERFTAEEVEKRHPMQYIPFGDGPRNCIGARFAVFQTKLGLIKILKNYRVTVCEKTEVPYVIDKSAFLLCPKGGVYLKLEKDNSS